jgi:hypothetical protein
MTPRKKALQSLYLEPEQAKWLDEVATETRIPKAVLLREAVDDLLSRYSKGVISPRYVKVRTALKAARGQLSLYRREITQRKLGIVPLQGCDRAIDRIDEANASVGD